MDVSAVSHWLAGRKAPTPKHLVKALIALRRWPGKDWTVPEALDGIAPLGWTREDIWHILNEDESSADERTFREWWLQGKPQPLPQSPPPLPTPFVPRTEQSLLQRLVTEQASWRQARRRAVIVTGVAGIGKTTLLAALSRNPHLHHHFRDGVLWLDGTRKDLLEQAVHRIGLKGPPAVWQEEWARWALTPAAASWSSQTMPFPMRTWMPSSPPSAPRSSFS